MLRTRMVFTGLLALLLAGGGATLAAQERPGAPTQAQRDSLEARVRARMGLMLRNQLGLNDEQVRRFQATNQRFEGQRRELFEQERTVRRELREALSATDTTRQQAQVAALLDRTLELQRRRLDLIEAEQRELATFLSPVQRARLFGIEEQIRRRVMELREGGNRPGRAIPPGGRRPGTPGSPAGGPRRPPEGR